METPCIPLCRHIKTDGHNCRAAALSDSAFCRHHQKLHRTRRRTISSGPGLSTNVLYPLRRAATIHDALSMVLHGIATGQIEPKRANLMLRAIKLAFANYGKPHIE
jgi:hypothetical protein